MVFSLKWSVWSCLVWLVFVPLTARVCCSLTYICNLLVIVIIITILFTCKLKIWCSLHKYVLLFKYLHWNSISNCTKYLRVWHCIVFCFGICETKPFLFYWSRQSVQTEWSGLGLISHRDTNSTLATLAIRKL